MMRLVVSCIWICVVTAASGYVSATWRGRETQPNQTADKLEGLEHKKVAPINVPMIANGNVEGYVVAQFVYLMDSHSAKQLSVPPDVFITDEAFRMIYADQVDFNHLEKYDIAGLTKELNKRVNRRLGEDIVKEVLVEAFNYIPKREISK
jgi:hypothetical protein